jgi:DNA-binding response OmpR family regulator
MKRVLIVEDDKHQRWLYEHELAGEGYEVIATDNGRDALACMDVQKPDLVVLDIAMPGMDGVEALGRIVSKSPTTPVLLHSAYSHFRNNFMTWSADAYVVKSADLSEFIATVHELLHDNESPVRRTGSEGAVGQFR